MHDYIINANTIRECNFVQFPKIEPHGEIKHLTLVLETPQLRSR